MALDSSNARAAALLAELNAPRDYSLPEVAVPAPAAVGVRGRTGGEVLQDVAVQLGGGVVDLGQAAYGLANVATLGTLDRLNRVTGDPIVDFQRTQDIVNSFLSDPTQRSLQELDEAFKSGIGSGIKKAVTDGRVLQNLGVRAIPSLFPSIAAARTASGAVAATKAASAGGLTAAARKEITDAGTTAAIRAGAAQSAGAVNVDAVNRALEAGATPAEAQLAGLVAAPIAGVATAGISRFTGAGRLEAEVAGLGLGGARSGAANANALIRIPKAIVGGGVREATEESLQSGVEQAATNLMAPGVDIREGVGKSAALGGVAGGLLGGGLGGVRGFRAPSPLREQLDSELQSAQDEIGQAEGRFQTAANEANPPAEAPPQSADPVERRREELRKELFSELTQNDAGVAGYTVQNPLSGEQDFLTLSEAESLLEAVTDREFAEDIDFNNVVNPAETAEEQQLQASRVDKSLGPIDFVSTPTSKKGKSTATDDVDATRKDLPKMDVDISSVEEIEATLPEALLAEQESRDNIIEKITGDRSKTNVTQADVLAALGRRRAELYRDVTDLESGVTYYRGVNPFTGKVEVLTRDKANKVVKRTIRYDIENPLAPSIMAVLRENGSLKIPITRTPQESINNATGVGVKDVRTEQQVREEFIEAEMFEPSFNVFGKPVSLEYDYDLQRYKVVSRADVKRRVRERIAQEDRTIADRWKDFFVAEFGLSPKSLTGKAFQFLAEQAELQGVEPGTVDGLLLLKAVSRDVGDPASTSAFAGFLGATFGGNKITPAAITAKFNPLVRFDMILRASVDGESLRNAWNTIQKEPKFLTLKEESRAILEQTFAKLDERASSVGSDHRGESSPQKIDVAREAAAKSLNDPSPEEAAKVQAGVEGKNVEGVLTWVAENAPDKQQRKLALALLDSIKNLQLNGFSFSFRVAHVGELVPSNLIGARGLALIDTTDTPTGSDTSISVLVNGADVTGKVGVRFETVLHEMTHAATLAALLNPNPSPAVSAAKKGLFDLLANLHKDAIDRQNRGEFVSDFEAWMLSRNAVSTDIRELVSYALTNKEVQAYLQTRAEDGTPLVAGKRSAFAKFVGWIKQLLGIEKAPKTAFDTVARATDTLMKERLSADFSAGQEFNVYALEAVADQVTVEQNSKVPESAEDFEDHVDQINSTRGGKVPVVLFDTPGHYEAFTGEKIFSDTKGVYDGQRVALIRSNLSSVADMVDTVMHERGHEGLRGLFGDRLSAVTSRVWANTKMRPLAQAKMKLYGYSRAVAAEEVLVDMLLSGEKLNKSVVSKMRASIETTAAKMLGVGDYVIGDKAIDQLLKDTAAFARDANVTVTGTRLTDKEANKVLDDALLDPGALSDVMRFSRSVAELQSLTGFSNPSDAKPITKGVKAAVDGTVDALRAAKGSIQGEAGLFKGLLAFMPLNQIVNFFTRDFDLQPLFDDDGKPMVDAEGRQQFAKVADAFNPLTVYQRLTRDRHARMEKTLLKERDFTYETADGSQTFNISVEKLAKQWQSIKKNSPEQGKLLDFIQQFGTLFHLYPDGKKQPVVDEESLGFAPGERAKMQVELEAAWKRLDPVARQVYQKSQAVYAGLWQERFEVLSEEIERVTGVSRYERDANGEIVIETEGSRAGKPRYTADFWEAYGKRIDSALNQISNGPYSPLQRYGDYTVTVRDEKGNIHWFSAHDNKAEQERQAAHARTIFADKTKFFTSTRTMQDMKSTLSGVGFADIDGIQAPIVERLKQDMLAKAAKEGLSPDQVELSASAIKAITDGLTEAALQSRSQGSLLRHAIQRKNVSGFSMDSFRAFNDYSTKAAKNIASIAYDGQIERNFVAMQQRVRDLERSVQPDGIANLNKMQTLVDTLKQQNDASRNMEANKVTDVLSAYSFAHFMSSPSQLFVNATQTLMVAFPRLASQFGGANAISAVSSALKLFAQSRGDFLGDKSKASPQVRAILEELYERGVLDFTQAHDLAGLARGEHGTLSERWRRIAEVAGVFMHKSEVFNRQVTAHAAIELALKKNPNLSSKAVADIAENAVYDTHFDYSVDNKPTVLQGPWRRVIFQFQQYRLNMLALIARDIRDGFVAKDATPEEKAQARSALYYMMGMQLMMTGAVGTVLSPVVFALMDAFGDDEDLLDAETRFVRSVPPILAHGLAHGLIDLSRVEGAGLLPYFGERRFAPVTEDGKEAFAYYAARYLGPSFSLAGDITKFASKVASGDVKDKDFESVLPKGMAGFVKAFNEAGSAKTTAGVAYFEPNLWDTVNTAVGLKSGSRREADEMRGASYEAGQRIRAFRSRTLGRLSVGIISGDKDAIAAEVESIVDWNTAHPTLAIDGNAIKGAVNRSLLSELYGRKFGLPGTALPAVDVLNAIRADLSGNR